MAVISDYLNKILSAVYGKDVRQAICDALRQCYEDGNAGSIDLSAREKIDLLTSRVENLTANSGESTAENAELIDIRVGEDGVTYENAGTAVRTQIASIKILLEELQGSASISMKLKNALLNCFSNVAWSNENGQVYYNELKEALELVKTMSLLYEGKNVTVKGERIYSDMGFSQIENGNKNGTVFASDLFEEDATIKVTLIPSLTCWNPSYIGIAKIDEWENQFSTSSTGYIYNATKFPTMTVDMEYTITLNVKAGYQVVFFIGGTNTAEPEIEVFGAVEE